MTETGRERERERGIQTEGTVGGMHEYYIKVDAWQCMGEGEGKKKGGRVEKGEVWMAEVKDGDKGKRSHADEKISKREERNSLDTSD